MFSQAYLGSDGARTGISALHLYTNTPRANLDVSFMGQSGFKYKFRERDDRGNYDDKIDQTDHFAAYLSLGINDQKSAGYFHMMTDLTNKPDVLLGAAQYIGGALMVDPSKLSRIGQTIHVEICGNW